jgi:CheY-like chemotaxis protein
VRYERLKILIVDDSSHVRTLITEILRALGCQDLMEASDGTEGLHILRSRPVDIVITDLEMRPLDGLEFTHLVRNSPDSPNPMIPIIMLTGQATLRRVAEARDAGVNEFLTKPLTAQAVIGRIGQVIEHPRTFVRTDAYFGPDRRRRADPNHPGPFRRSTDR